MKQGYKQTEVGIIPEEWDDTLLDNFAKRGSGHTPDKKHPEYWNGRIKWISLADSPALDRVFIYDTFAKVTPEGIANSSAVLYPAGTVVLSRDAGVGKSAIMRTEMAVSQHFMAWRCGSNLDNHFLYYWLQSVKPEFERIANGSTIKTIGLPYFKALKFPRPPLAEQRAIAIALSDVDGLLAGLERLIAKKRDLKQAAMQQLLTGKTRLPGFHGEWDVKRLKQVAEISTGINKPLSEMGSGALYVTVQDLYDKTSIRTERLSRIKVSLSEIEKRGLMTGDIVFGKSSVKRDGIGYPSQFLGCDEPVVFSGFTYRARARLSISDATFLFYALREETTRRWLIDNSQASALTNINQTIADAIPVQFPPSVLEQTAIAEVLMGMDNELATLEQQQEKTRALKQAMMQELLTGRTRLVSNKVAHA